MSDNPENLVRNGSHLPQHIQIIPYAADTVLLNTTYNDGENPFSFESMTTALEAIVNELFSTEPQPSVCAIPTWTQPMQMYLLLPSLVP